MQLAKVRSEYYEGLDKQGGLVFKIIDHFPLTRRYLDLNWEGYV